MSVLLIKISSLKPSGNKIASKYWPASIYVQYIRVEEKDGNDDGKSNDNAQRHIIGHKPREMDTLKNISKGGLFLFGLTVEVSIMMHHISGFTLSILLTIPIIVETSDSLFDSGDILLPSNGELPDDTTDLFTNNGELLSSFDETLASAQSDCTSNGDIDNLFFSSDIARLRPRINACLPPLPSIINIYDSNAILNQFAPSTFSKPDIQIPSTQKKQNPDVLRLDELFNLPAYTHDINPTEQDDVCPEELFDKSQTPVCQAEKWARNTLRRPKEDYYTLWNVRKCMSHDLWSCFDQNSFVN